MISFLCMYLLKNKGLVMKAELVTTKSPRVPCNKGVSKTDGVGYKTVDVI